MIRSEKRIIAGVCAAIAENMQWKLWLLRLLLLFSFFWLHGIILVVYLVLWLVWKNSPEQTQSLKREKHLKQCIGVAVGGFVCWLIVFVFYYHLSREVSAQSYGGFAVGWLFVLSFIAIPVGGVIGLFFQRWRIERLSIKSAE